MIPVPLVVVPMGVVAVLLACCLVALMLAVWSCGRLSRGLLLVAVVAVGLTTQQKPKPESPINCQSYHCDDPSNPLYWLNGCEFLPPCSAYARQR